MNEGPTQAHRHVAHHLGVRWLLPGAILTTAWLLAALPVAAQDDMACEGAISQAESSYFEGRFDEAVQSLNRCLSEGAFTGQEEEKAYTLLGKVYFAKGLEDQAVVSLRKLMAIVPDYRPDPTREPPDFMALVEQVRRELALAAPPSEGVGAPPSEVAGAFPQEERISPADSLVMAPDPVVQPPEPEPTAERAPPKKRSGITKWLAIGGGALVAGVAAVLLSGGDSSTGGGNGGTSLPPPPMVPGQ